MENISAPHVQKNSSVVVFKLDKRTFALPLEVIVQILPMMTITPIPHLSNIVKGTINIRGEDVLVVSLRNHFNMEEVDMQLYTPLLLLKFRNRSLALVVDAVMDVMNLPLETLTGMQTMLPEGIENLPLLKGVSHHNDDTILVLDPDNLFYNHRSLIQSSTDLKTSAPDDTPAKDTPIAGALASSSAPEKPVTEKKPAEKQIAEKKPSEKKSAENKAAAVKSAQIVEDKSVAASTPAADEKSAKDAPVTDEKPAAPPAKKK